MVDKLEALLDAISNLRGWSDPSSVAYQIRNPLLIQSFSLPGKNEIDSEGHRIFKTEISGFHSCLYDLTLKVKGESRAGLKKEDKLENLLRVYGVGKRSDQEKVVMFLKKALHTGGISTETPLTYFYQESK